MRIAVAAFAALLVLAAPAAAQSPQSPASPGLIRAAQERGDIDRATAARYLLYAVAGDARLPDRFASATPFDATPVLSEIRRAARVAPASRSRALLREAVAARTPKDANDPLFTRCDVLSAGPKTDKFVTEHFYIEYNQGEPQGGPTIEQYAQILEAAWKREVDQYGWARPPFVEAEDPSNPPLDRYHVRLDPLSPVVFGFVSSDGTYAGDVGDNPHTPWKEEDAQASCMALNNDFSQFAEREDVPDDEEALNALAATVAHEFNHSVHNAYGGLTGDDDPDLHFTEGMATLMEDEVFETANDNLRYLYPDFTDSMGQYEGDEYGYWFIWRGLVERFGIGVPGGAEEALQGFWELRSRGDAANTAPVGLDAVRASLAAKGVRLEDAYHAFAAGAKFVKPCGGPLAPPLCFAESALYTGGGRGIPASHGAVDRIGDAYTGSLEDNFALNWIDLPRSAEAEAVTLRNTSAGGRFRLSVICDLGTTLRGAPGAVAAGGGETTVRFDASGCLSRPVAVVTNETQTAPDPDESSERGYEISVATAPPLPASQTNTGTTNTTTNTTTNPTTPTTPADTACTYRSGFGSASASGRGRRARFAFAGTGGRVDVDVFQHSVGRRVVGERLVARYTNRSRSFTWNGRANRRGRRVADGMLSVRFTTRTSGGRVDRRRETLRRSGGRYFAARDFDLPESCSGVRRFKLLRPVFGGRSNRANDATFVLGGEATVTLEIRKGSEVVRRIEAGRRAPGVRHRLRVDAEGLPRGELELRLIVQAAGRPLEQRLYARRL